MKERNTIDQIYQHVSIRSYKRDDVPHQTVNDIVATAQRSSTSYNLQTYSVIAVTDPEKRKHLAELCGNQKFILQAPVFLAWCADLSRLDRICRKREYRQVTEYVEDFLVSAMDATLAMQTAAIAAESMGLGMCFIGAIRNHPREVIELLRLPKLVFPVSGMTLGWASAKPPVRPRLPLRAILHWEEYDTFGEEEALQEYDMVMLQTGIYDGRQVAISPGMDQIDYYGWMEHSARRVTKAVRGGLRATLKDQGFDMK